MFLSWKTTRYFHTHIIVLHLPFYRLHAKCLCRVHSISLLGLRFWTIYCYRIKESRNCLTWYLFLHLVWIAFLLCPWSILHWKHFFTETFLCFWTRLVYSRLEFEETLMHLCSFNSHCDKDALFYWMSCATSHVFICHLTRWLCETLYVREGPLTWLIRATHERWSFVCHRAAPPLHHKDHISFKGIYVYAGSSSSPVVQIPFPKTILGQHIE